MSRVKLRRLFGYEFLATAVTYKIIGFLKRQEGLDVYDRGTDFNPFAITK